MKTFNDHKFWGLASFACMGAAAYSAAHMDEMPSRDTHKTWGIAAFACMAMTVMSGYMMVADHKRKALKAEKAAEAEAETVSEEEAEVPEENPETEE